MRVTNNMIMENASRNINATKELVDKRNTQMTTQKKINKPSDDPVIAIRSLRLSTTLSKVGQYYDKNIPDAASWLEITETALINIKELITDARTLANKGATDTLTADDRNTIITQLSALQTQMYMEGNADYANRTVFTGYRTDRDLVFTEDELKTQYKITETIKAEERVEEHRYYSGDNMIPTNVEDIENVLAETPDATKPLPQDTVKTTYYRARMSYGEIGVLNGFSIDYKDATGQSQYTDYDLTNDNTVVQYDTETEWEADTTRGKTEVGKDVADDKIVFIKETGEFIFGKNFTKTIMENKATVSAIYTKTGFDKGELRPEFYFDCQQLIDKDGMNVSAENGTFKKYNDDGSLLQYDIQYIISSDQYLTVNTEAIDVFDQSLQRDIGEMINTVQRAIDAHAKVDELKNMMSQDQYAGADTQKALEEWLAMAQKEADYADDDLQRLYSTELGKIDAYLKKINLGITAVGCTTDQLNLTKTRVNNQQETVQSLQSENEDLDLSKIIIDYTAAYTAYQASLTAASKLGSMTLLNYL